MAYMKCGFRNSQMSKYLQERSITKWVVKKKTTLIEDTRKETIPRFLQTDKIFTNVEENLNHADEKKILLLTLRLQTISGKTEMMPYEKKGVDDLLYIHEQVFKEIQTIKKLPCQKLCTNHPMI